MVGNSNYMVNNLSQATIVKIVLLCMTVFILRVATVHYKTRDTIKPSSSNDLKTLTNRVPSHQHRPLVHFSPSKNWINDPNGLVFYDGEWHLFYQHNPHTPTSVNMHWGHSVSEDLIAWTELPIAIEPEDDIVGIWSGSVVIDWKNTTGFQKNMSTHPMIAIYTWQKQRWQEQHMAYSLDRGRTWTKYSSNPIIPMYNNVSTADRLSDQIVRRPFRDPKVFYHIRTSSWILVLTGGDHVQFYRSSDLIHWSLVSQFGLTDGSHGGTWECPDLIEFPQRTLKNRTSLWVLLVSVQRNAPAGGSGMQYFIGTFDGNEFHNIQPPETINWLDYGPDFYAGITFHNIPGYDRRQILISWMSNWQYANNLPTAPLWRGQMTIPRQLQLDLNSYTNKYHLRQTPVQELTRYSKRLITYHHEKLSNMVLNMSRDVYMFNIELHKITKATTIHLKFRENSNKSEYTQVSYIGEKNQIELDRTRSGLTDFHSSYPVQFNMNLDRETLITGRLQLQLIIDRCSIELFVNEGKYTMTSLIFPKDSGYQIEITVDGHEIFINYLELMLFSL
ncbi:unnamed protein product [Adineta ricciae]|uniref:Uncharacterized protein n=1 Tax=Adineta ricciae TaxID=249248 RepID=A0A816CPQ2_ADIRI|nr:unnamed protein product [Adineta ricciae]CAF1625375.1 unnamed protein product [Adineta ricciae]